MSKIKRVTLNQIEKGMERTICLSIRDRAKYEDGKSTGQMESTVIETVIAEVGVCQIVLPYEEGLADKLNAEISFGELFTPSEHFEFSDVQIGLYDNSLSIKYLATLK